MQGDVPPLHPGIGTRRAPDAPIRLSTILVYSAPSAWIGFAFFLVSLYLLKFSTDVLLLPPAWMGVMFGASKLWDAVSDPLAGHLSDRTRSRWGRRRSWLLASIVPFALGNVMIWSPPGGLSNAALGLWVGLGLCLFYTATTMFQVPHESLAAELSLDHHERTRIFGLKHLVGMGGTLLAVGGLQLLDTAEEPRGLAYGMALVVSGLMAVATCFAVASVRERARHQGRGGVDLVRALRDVFANPHARLLLVVFGIENAATAILSILAPFVLEYVYDLPDMTGIFILAYFVPAVALIPFWIRFSYRAGKKPLWLFSMVLTSLAFAGIFFVESGDAFLLCALAFLAGIGGGCGQVVAPSIQADVIDWDELRTGERKEGVYFAVWNFVRKAAHGLTAAGAGVLLAALGYEPNAEQTETTRLGLRMLFGLVPAAVFATGTLLFLRFRLTQETHAEIRSALDERER